MKKLLYTSGKKVDRLTIFVKEISVIILVLSMLGLQFPQALIAASSKQSPMMNGAGLTYLGSLGEVVSKSSSTELVIETQVAVVTGNDILLALGTDPNSNLQVTVTDSAGNSYQQEALVINTSQIRTYLFAAYDVNSMPIGSEITISFSVAVTSHAAVAALFDGLADSDALDQLASATAANSSAPSSGFTSTTTQADELLIGVVGTEGPVDDAAGSWENSFIAGPRAGTTGGTADTNITITLGYRIVDTTGEYAVAISGITARDWGAIIGTFKADLVANKPTIVLSGTLETFYALPGSVSSEQIYTVSGINLSEDILINAPEHFEISLSSGSGFTDQLTLTQSGGTVGDTPIYVRFSMSSEGEASGAITHASSGATTRNVPVTGSSAPLNPVDFNIMLGRPTDESVTANIITDYDAEFFVDYGIEPGIYSYEIGPFNSVGAGTTPTFPIEPTEIKIDSLTGNTRYYYQIRYRRTGVTDWNLGAEYSFITQRSPGEGFTFTIISDSHLGQYGGQTAEEQELYRVTLQNVKDDSPDFHIDLGDTYAMDPSPLGTGMTEQEAHDAYYVQRPLLQPLTHSVPFFSILGNHENEEGWNFDDVFTAPDQSLSKVGMKYRKLFYPNPIPDDFYSGNTDLIDPPIGGDGYREDYWAWEWGDALFVVLDPFHYSMIWPDDFGEGYGGEGQDGEESGDRWDWSLGIEQYLWFKDTLETSTAKYKFVFAHHVTGGTTPYGRGGQSAAELFEWGGKNADGTWGWDTHRPASEGWTVPVHQLMIDNAVDIFFHGHDHMYAYEEVDGIAYVEVPKPDDAGYTWEPYSYGYNENLYPDAISILENSGHIRVTVSPDQVTSEYVRSYLPGDGENKNVAHAFDLIPPVTHDLTVDVVPDGAGTTNPPEGINAIMEGRTVEVTATANVGYAFDYWEGDVENTSSSTTTITMDAPKSITAHFTTIDPFTLTTSVNPSGAGTVSPSGSNDYNPGTVVALSATAASGFMFANWTGDVANASSATTTITMNDDETVIANFTEACYPLTLSHTGNGSNPTASPTSSDGCAVGSYHATEEITLSGAVPDAGYEIGSWSGTNNNSSTASTNTLTMPAGPRTVSVNYVMGCYALTLTHTGSGADPVASPTSSAGCVTGEYTAGQVINLSGALPASGWWIQSWEGTANDGSTASNNYLFMPAEDHAVTVNYVTDAPPTCYALTLGHEGQGSDPIATPANSTGCSAGTYTSGQSISLSGAVPASGWEISGWSGTANDSSTANTNSLLMPASAHMVKVIYIESPADAFFIYLPLIIK